MSRTRMIRPDFWDDERVCALSRDARLLLISCWNLADDEGLLVWSAPVLKEWAFAADGDLDEDAVAGLMAALVAAGWVVTYPGARGAAVGWLVHFTVEQTINRPKASRLPMPPLDLSVVVDGYARRDGVCRGCGLSVTTGGQCLAVGVVAGAEPYPSRVTVVHAGCAGGADRTLGSVPEFLGDAVIDAALPEGKKKRKGGAAVALGVAPDSGVLSEPRETMSATAAQPSMTSGTDPGEDDERGSGTADVSDVSAEHTTSSEEDEMGLYDKPVDPFAPLAVTPPRVAAARPEAPVLTAPAPPVTPVTSVGAQVPVDGQQVLLGVPALVVDAVVEPVASPGAKRRPRKKKSESGEQVKMFPPEVDQLCEHLAVVVRTNLIQYATEAVADRVSVTDKWRDAAEKMLRLDGFTAEQVTALIDWAGQDEFWRTNIRAMPKLREQAPRLAMDRRFLLWARKNSRASRAAVNGAVMPTESRAVTRSVDQVVDPSAYQIDGF